MSLQERHSALEDDWNNIQNKEDVRSMRLVLRDGKSATSYFHFCKTARLVRSQSKMKRLTSWRVRDDDVLGHDLTLTLCGRVERVGGDGCGVWNGMDLLANYVA